MDTLRQQEVLAVQSRVERLVVLLRLLIIVLTMSRFSLASIRIPEGTAKMTLLRAIERSCSVLPLRVVLRVIRLSHLPDRLFDEGRNTSLEDTLNYKAAVDRRPLFPAIV